MAFSADEKKAQTRERVGPGATTYKIWALKTGSGPVEFIRGERGLRRLSSALFYYALAGIDRVTVCGEWSNCTAVYSCRVKQ